MPRVCRTTTIEPRERVRSSAPPRSEAIGASRRARGAFSLIELLIVVAIVSAVAAMAVPRFTEASEGRRLDLAQERIETALGAWSERARLESDPMIMHFDQDAETLALYRGDSVDELNRLETIELGEDPYRVEIVTRSDLRGDTVVALSAHGIVGGGLSVDLGSGSLTRTVTLP